VGEELLGIEEIELALGSYEPILNIKKSEFPNVIQIELTMEPAEALNILKNTPTTVISKVVPIEFVVRTRMNKIIEKATILAGEKVDSGDSFSVRCDLRGRKYIKSKDELINSVSEQLIEKLNLLKEEKDPDWVVQVEVVGENTGISVLKPEEILKKV